MIGSPKLTIERARCLWRRASEDDDGFSLVEVVVSVALFVVVLMCTAIGADNVLVSSLASREHSVATGLVSQAVSKAEALPFSALQAGTYPADLAGDPNVVSSGGGTYVLALNGATIDACATSGAEPPLVPHVTTVVLAVTYHVAVYPTVGSASCGSNPTLVTLVVVVSWVTPSGAAAQVVSSVGISAP